MTYLDAKRHADQAASLARNAAGAGDNLAFFTQQMGQAVAELATAVSELASQDHRES
jgi:hypothetical protein